MVEEDLMTEVLVNLIDNAIKASPEGAEILSQPEIKA